MIEFIQIFAASLLAAVIAIFAGKYIYKNTTQNIQSTSSYKAIIDSNALIDGRIVDLIKLGFVVQEIVVPEFILAELQLLADGSDSQKRERARYGLEVVQQLQALESSTVTINHSKPDADMIDDKLVALAKRENASLLTNDFNLNQVASIKGVKVLNINELAHALRPHVLPGEIINVVIVQVGSNRDQGVGYLEDGTMIVVDGAKRDIGKAIKATVTRSHQTVAGKMIFAKKDVVPERLRNEQRSHKTNTLTTQKAVRLPSVKKQTYVREGAVTGGVPVPKKPKDQHINNKPRRRQSHKEHAEAKLIDAIDQQKYHN